MSIQNLSVDCLKLIFDLVDAYDIGHLWCVGSMRLQWILSEGRALRNLRFKYEPMFPLVWPNLVHQIPHLEHLSVHIDACYSKSLDFRANMKSLPCNLKSLEFFFHNAISHFNEVIAAYPALFSKLERLFIQPDQSNDRFAMDLRPLRSLTDFQHIPFLSRNLCLESVCLPPHLTNLSVFLPSVTPEWFEALPSSLTGLHLKLLSPYPVFHLLPRQLLDFSITLNDFRKLPPPREDWSSLPQNLTSLRIRCVEPLTPSDASHLPKSLTLLDIGFGTVVLEDDVLLEIIKQLPPTLKEIGSEFGYLWRSMVSKEFALALPRTLRQGIKSTRVDYDAISSLPQGIQHITLNPPNLSPDMAIPSFPRNLRSISNFGLDVRLMKSLPETVTAIESAKFPIDFTPEFALALPPLLEVLMLQGKDNYSLNLIEESFLNLPRTLKRLNLWFPEKYDSDDDDDEGPPTHHQEPTIQETLGDENEKVPAKAASNLPLGLKYFRLINLPLDPEFLPQLPLSLVSIDVTTKSIPSNSFEAIKRFHDLEELFVSTMLPPSNWKTVLMSLPKKLRRMHWRQSDYFHFGASSWETNLDENDFAFLPRGLISLGLPACPSIKDDQSLLKNILPKHLPHIAFGE